MTVYSDHSPLTSLYNKELIKIDNQRLVNMLERLADYNYSVKHLAGAKNAAADYLSRHTVTAGQAPEFSKGRVSTKIRTVRSPNAPEDASLWRVAEATKSCDTAKEIIEAIKAGKGIKDLPARHPGKDLADVWNEMGIENTAKGEVLVVNQKLYIPRNLRKELLK